MKIKTQFIIATTFFGVMLLVIATSVIITNQKVQRLDKQEEIAINIERGASDLGYLSNEYLLYRESQQQTRWETKFSSISNDLSNLNPDRPEQQAIVNNIKGNQQRLKAVFTDVVSALEGVSQTQDAEALAAFIQVSWSRMAVQNQGMFFDASRLSQLLRDQVDQLRQTRSILIFALIGLFSAFLFFYYVLTYRHLLKSISVLQAGTRIIGSGNLDYTVEEKHNDEIGDLSRAFNRMTANLKNVTASKVELEREIEERKKAEEALKEAEEEAIRMAREWENTFDAISDFITIHDRSYCITKANRALAASIGLSVPEVVGRACYELIHGTSDPWPDCPHRLAMEKKEPVTKEFYEPHLERHLEVSCSPIFDESGEVTGTVHLVRDITQRKQAEAELAHLASFPELNPNPIVEIDAAGNIKYLNPAARTLFPDLPARGSRHPFLANWEALVNTLKGKKTHFLNREINIGDLWHVQTVAYVPSTQNFRVYGGDITERKKAEEALRETTDFLNNLLNYANAPIIVWTPDFEITRFNHAFERLTGCTADEVLGKKLGILFPDDSRDESMNHIRKAASGERWEVVEIPILHRNGTVRIVLWNSATLYAPDGETVVATIAQGQDITERKKAEEALKRGNVELEAANKELEAFSYSVSHDLRAPLRSMEGFSSALLEDYAEKLDDQGKQYLGYIQESSDLMARLIDDLIKLSRVTRSDMSYEKVNLSEMARNVVAELEKAEPHQKVKLNIAPDITAYGDRNLLRLVLENLLGNAWKFSGTVSSPRIEMGTLEYNGKQAYFVRDNGVGFDMTYAEKLFKPFQRLHKASEFSGTGIGLATVQRIIRRHGGTVWAESKVGEGATFYFTLS